MRPLLLIPLRVLLCASSALALAALASATPAAAQPVYRCIDKDGHVVIGKYAPGTVSPCREDAIPVPKAILSQPVTEKELETVKQHLNQRIQDSAALEARCQAQHESIEESKEDALDAIDALADNRSSGRVSRGEQRASKRIEASAAQAHASIKRCVATVQAQIAETRAILSNPERLRAEVPNLRAEQFRHAQAAMRERQLAEARREAEVKEAAERQALEERTKEQRREAAVREEREKLAAAERLSEELREQWLVLLENARSAHAIFASGASYEDFSLRLEAMGKQVQLIRVKYARQIQLGDHKALGMAVYATCAALTAANPDWQKERQVANDLALLQATAARYRNVRQPSALDRANADESMRRLRETQQAHEQAKAQLAAKRDLAAQSMSEAIRVAKGEQEPAQRVTVGTRKP